MADGIGNLKKKRPFGMYVCVQ